MQIKENKNMEKLVIGWSEQNITPDRPVSLCGQFAERISVGVEKPITVTALALSAGNEQMVLVSADLAGIGYPLRDAVREKVRTVPGLDPEKIMISAIHTHTSMEYAKDWAYPDRFQEYHMIPYEDLGLRAEDHPYLEAADVKDPELFAGMEAFDWLTEKIALAVKTAWEAREPGSFVHAFGRAAVGMCRRTQYNDRTAAMWGDTNTARFESLEGGNDSGIELIYTFGRDGKLTGIIPNIACPAQCVQHRMFISPDFWGESKQLLRRRFGKDLFMLPLCSAAGDQCPVDLVRWVEPESDVHDPNIKRNDPPARKADPSMFDLSGMRVTGRRIAEEIIHVYEDGLSDKISEAAFRHEWFELNLPLRRVSSGEYQDAVRSYRDAILRKSEKKLDFNDVADHLIDAGIIDRYHLQELTEFDRVEIHIIRLGSIAFATNPFELFLDYGNQIRARSKAEQTFLIQLCNGDEGYLPTKKAEKHGHYSAIVGSGYVGHEGGDLLVRATLDKINELFTEQTDPKL